MKLAPDSLFLNGRFWTLNPDIPRASALAVSAGRVAAVGESEDLRELAGPETRVHDLQGRWAVPGLVDAHCHLVSHGMICRREADLRGAGSIADLQSRLRLHLESRGGSWVLGRAFDQDLLEERRWPTRRDLDEVTSTVPIRITRVCGHAMVVNSAALKTAGLETSAGAQEGLFTEDAMAPIYSAIPAPGPDEWLAAAEWACDAAARAGFTGIHSLMAHRHEVDALVRLRSLGRLKIRVRMQLPYSMLEHAAATGLATGFGDEWLTIGAIKIFSDGSLGARTAALREEYADDPGNRGQLIFDQAELDRRVQAVADAGFQVAVHAIGDAALEQVLLSFERCRNPQPRPRVEHASLCPPDLMERMRAIGVVAAVQPQFIVSDFWTPERLGPERDRWAYPFRTMLDQGIVVAGSTDCPVEALDALQAWQRAIDRDGRRPEENLSAEEALRLFTEGSAAAAGEESEAGRLQRGMRADFVTLQEECDPEHARIEKQRVTSTFVGGSSAVYVSAQ